MLEILYETLKSYSRFCLTCISDRDLVSSAHLVHGLSKVFSFKRENMSWQILSLFVSSSTLSSSGRERTVCSIPSSSKASRYSWKKMIAKINIRILNWFTGNIKFNMHDETRIQSSSIHHQATFLLWILFYHVHVHVHAYVTQMMSYSKEFFFIMHETLHVKHINCTY